MKEARRFFAAAHHQVKGFLVSGSNDENLRLSSTEITIDGITFVDFTPLPFALGDHCMVALDGDNDGDFFLVGGDTDDDTQHNKKAFVHRGSQWVEVREMPTARQGKKPIGISLCRKVLNTNPEI